MRLFALLLGLVVFVLDLVSKLWATKTLWDLPGYRITVIDGFFRLHGVRNEGIAFGLLHSTAAAWKPYLLNAAAIAALAVVLYYIISTPIGGKRLFVSYGLLLGGILGNFGDRLMHGYVVDFIELHWGQAFIWPTFNVADASITCGVALLLMETFRAQKEPDAAADVGEQRSLSCLTALPLFLTVMQNPGAEAPSAVELLQDVQERYRSVSTLAADFRQISTDRGIRQEERGVVYLKKPNKMLWEYQEPSRKFFVADGNSTVLYLVDARQAYESDFDLESSDSPLLLLVGRQSLSSDFDVTVETEEQPVGQANILLRLRPRRAHPEYAFLLLEIEPEERRVQRLSVVEHIGNRNDYILSRIRENVRVEDSRFRLRIPKNVEWIR